MLVDLPQEVVEWAQDRDPGVQPHNGVRVDVRPDPRLPRATLPPVRDKRRDFAHLDPSYSVEHSTLEAGHSEVEDDHLVEDVRPSSNGAEQVEQESPETGVRSRDNRAPHMLNLPPPPRAPF
jgi:hypothetical protein